MTEDLPTFIQLDQFLKFAGIAETGGQAKHLIRDGEVLVNDEVETRRSRKLYHGDRVQFDGESYSVEFEDES